MKKIIALLITVLMLVSCICISSSAAWDGTATAEFAGTGTEADPYVIDTEAKLAKLAELVNAGESYAGKYFTQTADLDLGNKEWTPIGNASDKAFSGIYNGLGHSISNLFISVEASHMGLFGNVASTQEVEAGIANLTVNGKINYNEGAVAAALVGGIAGNVNPNVAKDAKMKDFYVLNVTGNVDITITNTAVQPRVGGLFGQIYCSLVENCVNNGKILSTGGQNVARLGGFCGQCNRTTFRYCTNNGDVTAETSNNKNPNAGGFCAYITVVDSDETYTVFTYCVNNGNISAKSGGEVAANAAGFNANAYAGSGKPIRAKIENCVNNGKISAIDGGTSTGYPYAGGISAIGQAYPNFNIDACVNTVPASDFVSEGGAGARAGGIIGACWQAAKEDVWVRNTVSASNTCPAYSTPTTADDKATWLEDAADRAAVAAKAITDAFVKSMTKINGIEVTKEEAPVNPPVDPVNPPVTGDNAVVFAAVAVVALTAILGCAKLVKKEN